MAKWEGDDLTYWIDFNQWKTQGSQLLGGIWKAEGWDFTEEQLRAALVRKEAQTHKNRPESYQRHSPEKIDDVCGPDYRIALAKCKQ